MTKVCIFCNFKMKKVTEGRGYRTYACSKGCDYHLSEEVEVRDERNYATNGCDSRWLVKQNNPVYISGLCASGCSSRSMGLPHGNQQ